MKFRPSSRTESCCGHSLGWWRILETEGKEEGVWIRLCSASIGRFYSKP